MKIPPMKKTYGERTILNTPEITLDPGRIYAVIGANGSGKTTWGKIISGIEPNDNNESAGGFSSGYMPQKSYAFRMSTKSNILLGGKNEARCRELMHALQLDALAEKNARTLSGGETARMALARLFMGKYDVVILDEPTAAMDMESTIFSENLIKNYVSETNCALLLITHSLQQAKRIADNIFYLCSGEIAEAGDKRSVLEHPQDKRTKTFLEFYGI